jgi:tetratricopeptide (TPR) repeat protein
LLFRYTTNNQFASALTSLVLSFGILGVLFSFVEDKEKVPLRKRVITLAVVGILPFVQGIVPFLPKPPVSLTSADRGELDTAVSILKENEYKDSTVIRIEALPTLERLAKKYPKSPDVLLPLGVAQFAAAQFPKAIETFSTLVDETPSDFRAHYHLGISYKRRATVADEALDSGKPLVSGSTIDGWRREADVELRSSLSLYQTGYEGEGYYWWRIERNIGWLDYERSRKCADRTLCDNAIRYHKLAINGDGHSAGNPDYILAFNNLGEIYLKLGDRKNAEAYLIEGVRRHQAMLDRHDPDAAKAENHYVYTALASLYFEENEPSEGFDLLVRATRVFPLDEFKSDSLNAYMVAQLQRAAEQSRPRQLNELRPH